MDKVNKKYGTPGNPIARFADQLAKTDMFSTGSIVFDTSLG